ncbi:MAG: cell division protein, partial [Haloplanus sp.]
VSSIGYAATAVDAQPEGLVDRWGGGGAVEDPLDDASQATKIKSLVRRATNSRLTLPCEVSSAERVLVVLSGPPSEFSRKGIESARQWLEQEAETVEVLVGDDPRENSSRLAAAVLLSNVSGAPRIETLQNQAVDAQEQIAEQEAAREQKINDLITDENDDLDPVV